MKIHDNHMPKGWHQIKCALLDEIATAANFDLCKRGADALFHARLIGQSIANEFGTECENGQMVGGQQEASDE